MSFLCKRIPILETRGNEYKPLISKVSALQKRSVRHDRKMGGVPKEMPKAKLAEWEHMWYRWDYKLLPKQTTLSEKLPHKFSIRPSVFSLTGKQTGLTRKVWRERVLEISSARKDETLEQLARSRKLLVSIDDIEEEWEETFGQADLKELAKFYGIETDLFDGIDLKIETFLKVSFDNVEINRGNIVRPADLSHPPTSLNFQTDGDGTKTSLVLTNLDSHPTEQSKEILHWMVCNVPDGDLTQGETIVPYLPPLPWKGSGFHRHVLTLYKHSDPIDSSLLENDFGTLKGRTFSSANFIASTGISPIGICWCQVEWDESVTDTCSQLEDIPVEPVFDWEQYLEPKEELAIAKEQLGELRYREM